MIAVAEILVPRVGAVDLRRTPIDDSRKTSANRPSHTGASYGRIIYRQSPAITTQLIQLMF